MSSNEKLFTINAISNINNFSSMLLETINKLHILAQHQSFLSAKFENSFPKSLQIIAVKIAERAQIPIINERFLVKIIYFLCQKRLNKNRIQPNLTEKYFFDKIETENLYFEILLDKDKKYENIPPCILKARKLCINLILSNQKIEGYFNDLTSENYTKRNKIKDSLYTKYSENSFYYGDKKNNLPFNGIANNAKFNNQIFTGHFKDGVLQEGEIQNLKYKNDRINCVVKNAALSNNKTKFQRPDTQTPFQNLISINNKSEDIKKRILMGEINTKKLTEDEMFDINNDNVRRFFETVLAKKMLLSSLNTERRVLKMTAFTNFLLNFAKKIIDPSHYSAWLTASKQPYTGRNTTLQQFSLKIKDFERSMDGTKEQNTLLLLIYKLHYLQYLVEGSKVYKNNESLGVDTSLYSSDNLYVKRGRLDNGHMRQIESKNFGILRSLDKTPHDLQDLERNSDIKNRFNIRCPDRFDMDLPLERDNKDKDSWLSYNFSKQVHPVVNGMSGSMLCQIRFLVFCKNYHDHNKIKYSPFQFDIVRNYIRIVSSLFIYYEGGHALNEIMSPFYIEIVKKRLELSFPDFNTPLNFGSILFYDNDALDPTIKETESYYNYIRRKDEMHNQLLNLQRFKLT